MDYFPFFLAVPYLRWAWCSQVVRLLREWSLRHAFRAFLSFWALLSVLVVALLSVPVVSGANAFGGIDSSGVAVTWPTVFAAGGAGRVVKVCSVVSIVPFGLTATSV